MLYENESFQLNPEKMPKHVAIIMDGNGRWATKRGLPRKAGHKAGAEALERIIYAAKELGLEHLTVYAFSTENWKRSAEEVGAIMDLLRFYLKNYFKKFVKDNIRMHVIGEKSRLDTDIQKAIAEIEDLSGEKNGMTVHVALNYGGRDEILRAVKQISQKVSQGELTQEEITEEVFSRHLYTAGQPDPDLIIRPSGEQRISNFLLWQSAYTEYIIMDILWPDFTTADLDAALAEYARRNRRFGGV